MSLMNVFPEEMSLTKANKHTGSTSPNGSAPKPDDEADNLPSIDPSILEGFLAAVGDEEGTIVTELVNIFLKDAPRLLNQMEQNFSEQDFETAQRAAHTLKSSAAHMGVMKLSSMSKEIEMMCRANQINNISQKLAQATAEFKHVKKIMETDKQIWAIPQTA